MPFGLKWTAGISGHYSEAQSGSMRKLLGDTEVGGEQWKTVGDSGRQVEGPEDMRKRVEDQEGVGRVRKAQKGSGRLWERVEGAGRLGKVTVCYRRAHCHFWE